MVTGRAERPRGDHLFLRDPLPNNSFAPAVICRRASGTADRAGAALGRPLKHVAPVQRARILTLAAKLLKSGEAQFSSGLRHGTLCPILRFGHHWTVCKRNGRFSSNCSSAQIRGSLCRATAEKEIENLKKQIEKQNSGSSKVIEVGEDIGEETPTEKLIHQRKDVPIERKE